MRRIVVGILCVGFLGGCAWFQQAHQDYTVGKTTPLVTGEVSPQQAAEQLVEPLKPFLPTPLQPMTGVVIAALTLFGTWRRGRQLRKSHPVSSNPITGNWGQRIGLESVVQHVAAISQGLFEVGPENSGLRRAWKILVAVVLAVVALPPVQTFVLAHPKEVGELTAALAAIAGLEKELSKVLPTVPNV